MHAQNGLPASYESLIVALDALGNDEKCFTFELVKSRLLQEEQLSLNRAATSTDLQTPSALLNVRGRFRQKGPNPYANHLCAICNNLGHSESHCWGKDINGKRRPRPGRPPPKQISENSSIGAHKDDGANAVSESEFVGLKSKLNESKIRRGLCLGFPTLDVLRT